MLTEAELIAVAALILIVGVPIVLHLALVIISPLIVGTLAVILTETTRSIVRTGNAIWDRVESSLSPPSHTTPDPTQEAGNGISR